MKDAITRAIRAIKNNAIHTARLIHASYLMAECGYSELDAYKRAHLIGTWFK